MFRNRAQSFVIAAALGAAFLASTGPSQAAGPVIVANPTFATNTSGWTPTSNAALTRVVDTAGATAGRATPTSSSGAKTIGMTSTASDAVATAGTLVHVAGQVRSTQLGKRLVLQLRELAADGSVIQRFDGVTSPSTTDWYWTGAKITTTRPNSRVSLYVHATDVTGKRFLQVRAIDEDLTPPMSPPPTQCADIDYSETDQGHEVFSDDFTGSAVDTTKWRVRDETTLSFDKARILARNVTVHDGLLDIAGKRETASGRDWTTGYIDTIGTFSQKYGSWEMRAKVPTDGARTRGVWPAFWLRSDTQPGEIDIMETWGSPATRTYNPSPSYEWTVWKDTTRATGNERFYGWAHPQTHSPPIYDDYHVYAVNWSPTCMTFIFDGTIVGTLNTDAAPWLTTNFDSPFNIRLNMQVGSDYWGFPDDTNTKPEFNYLVDYVRAYAPNS